MTVGRCCHRLSLIVPRRLTMTSMEFEECKPALDSAFCLIGALGAAHSPVQVTLPGYTSDSVKL